MTSTSCNSTIGLKFDQDKPLWGLLSMRFVNAVVRILTFGAKKYTPENWKNVSKEKYYEALMRHIVAWRLGEELDPETGESHLVHAATNLMFMFEHEEMEKKKKSQSYQSIFEDIMTDYMIGTLKDIKL